LRYPGAASFAGAAIGVSDETSTQQVGVQQPFEPRPPRFDLLESRHEHCWIVVATRIRSGGDHRCVVRVDWHPFRRSQWTEQVLLRSGLTYIGAEVQRACQAMWRARSLAAGRSQTIRAQTWGVSSASCPSLGHGHYRVMTAVSRHGRSRGRSGPRASRAYHSLQLVSLTRLIGRAVLLHRRRRRHDRVPRVVHRMLRFPTAARTSATGIRPGARAEPHRPPCGRDER